MRSPNTRRRWAHATWIALFSLFFGAPALAQAPKPQVPAPLTPWIPWVLEGAGDEPCPLVEGVHTCIWPSQLQLSVRADGGTFSMAITTDRALQVVLPGSRERWPEDVRVDNQAKPVLEPGGVPVASIAAGTHVISGRFTWRALPDTLQVPANLATLALEVNGQKVPFPRREADGMVWLRQGSAAADGEEERLELSVHRLIQDAVPLYVRTRVRVSVSGKGREIVLPNVLVPGTRPLELSATVPAQLTPEGTLRLQAEAGTYQLELLAIAAEPLEALSAPKTQAPWPEQETWVFQADDGLRHAELKGAPQVDASRTDLEPDWAGFPAYLLSAGQSLRVETRRRGQPEPPPNQLHLSRALWLDLDGDGYTVRDQLTGQVNRTFRLDLTAGALGHASVDGKDQLVTRFADKSGVELRRSALALQTEWKLEHGRSELPAVAYDEDVQSLYTTLHLPPGFMLLGSSGVDQLAGTWVDGWNLFDFFFVLLVSLAVGKLAGKAFFPLALLTLVLTHHEPEAPALAWLFLLVTVALVRVVREERWSKLMRLAFQVSVLGLVLVIVPFAAGQIRQCLYPHLELPYRTVAMSASNPVPAADQMARAPEAPPAQPAQETRAEGAPPSEAAYKLSESSAGGYDKRKYAPRGGTASQQEVDPNQVVQTGPGLPTWDFRSFELTWSGPVERHQQISLWILPPSVVRAWSLLSVLLSGFLGWTLTRAAKRPTGPSLPPSATALGLLATLSVGTAHAQEFPPQDLLQELRTRLTKPADCEPNCISVSVLSLAVNGTRLSLHAQVHAGSTTAYRVPGPSESWAPDEVRVDGKGAFAAARMDDGFVHVRLSPGLHTVEFGGPMPRSQALTLALGTPPHRVEVAANGYLVEGIDDEGHVEGSLSLRKEVKSDEDHPGELSSATQALEPWLLVRRELDLGIRFRVTTSIERVGAADDSVLVRFPLLPGESVTEAGLVSDQGNVVIELPRGQSAVSFSSVLAPRNQVDLVAATPAEKPGAPVQHPWSETWVVRPSLLYRTRFAGISPVTLKNDQQLYEPVYKPWPGEKLSITIDKLNAAAGESVTVDQALLELTPGARMEQGALTLQVRTSHGTSEQLALPADAALTGLQVDGAGRSGRLKDGKLELHLDPGSHTIKLWFQRPTGMDVSYASPQIAAKRSLNNVITQVSLPGDRWLLWASGPSWGPAVLFWGYFILALLAAFVLGRVPLSPLKTREWVLLALGLTQVEMGVVLFLVGWLFALAYRQRHRPVNGLWFNLTQAALALLTLVALSCLAQAVHQGLVVQPDMQVQGQDSNNHLLRWYSDHTLGAIPGVAVWSVPLWIYKGLMLLWALWLASSLLRWLRWGWTAFRTGGTFQRPAPKPPKEPGAGQNPQVPLDQIERAQAELDRAHTGGSREPDQDA